jgi:aspartate dehydrogenase
MPAPRDILLIGFGAIGRHLARALRETPIEARLAFLVRPGSAARLAAEARALAPGPTRLIEQLDATRFDLAVECAGHAALQAFGAACLAKGADLLIASVGALTDAALLSGLEREARAQARKLLIPAGAVAGIDALAAARNGGLARVQYTSRKPPQAWRGTPAEQMCDLDSLRETTEFYKGPAGEAARLFPQNANVAATVALAGLGFQRTECSLRADPSASGNLHLVEAEGAFGRLRIEVAGRTLPGNPKTSMLAALSLERAIRNRAAAIEI